MKTKYRISVAAKNLYCLLLDENGQLVIVNNEPGCGKYGYDYEAEPDRAARETARRVELYNREHLYKIIEVEADALDVKKLNGGEGIYFNK